MNKKTIFIFTHACVRTQTSINEHLKRVWSTLDQSSQSTETLCSTQNYLRFRICCYPTCLRIITTLAISTKASVQFHENNRNRRNIYAKKLISIRNKWTFVKYQFRENSLATRDEIPIHNINFFSFFFFFGQSNVMSVFLICLKYRCLLIMKKK